MPLYDYKCINCGNIQEEIHGMNEYPQILCNKCKSETKKQFSAGIYLGNKSETINISNKLGNKYGSGEDHKETPRGNIPMWPA